MNNQRFIAFALIVIGAIALLSRFGDVSGWLWVGLIAAGFLAVYVRQRTYSMLVVGSILTGVAVGILLESNLGWNGAFLISLGIGFYAIDQVERKSNRWPRSLAVILVALGVFSGIIDSGIIGSVWFALLLIVGGAYLLSRGGWVRFPPPMQPRTEPPAPPAEPVDTSATEPEPEPVTPEEPQPEQDPAIQQRLERLEAWRRNTAAEEDRAPYLILNNQTLVMLAEQNPQTLEQLRAIRGIGPVKLERYGEQLLAILHG